MSILIAQAVGEVARVLVSILGATGLAVETVGNAEEFRTAARRGPRALYVVDTNLADGDGIALLQGLRSRGDPTPALVISSRVAVADRVAGLDAGADDYLSKPFHPKEFVARARALLRRPRVVPRSVAGFGCVAVDQATGEFTCRGAPVDLRPAEQRLLALFILRPNRVVTRNDIECTVGSVERATTANATDQLVSRLRKALGRMNSDVEIETVRGSGYRLGSRPSEAGRVRADYQ